MRIILLGAPGAGKGTQSQLIHEKFHIPKISTGDILRHEVQKKSALGKQVQNIMKTGKLVEDALIIDLIKQRISEPDCLNGFLFDGFPRTLAQAQALISSDISIDYVIDIIVSDEVILQRLGGRRLHITSGRIYHTLYNPPKTEGLDDITGEPLIQRDDDKEIAIKKRLDVYHQQTSPLSEFYKNLSVEKQKPLYFEISGIDTTEKVFAQIIGKLEG